MGKSHVSGAMPEALLTGHRPIDGRIWTVDSRGWRCFFLLSFMRGIHAAVCELLKVTVGRGMLAVAVAGEEREFVRCGGAVRSPGLGWAAAAGPMGSGVTEGGGAAPFRRPVTFSRQPLFLHN